MKIQRLSVLLLAGLLLTACGQEKGSVPKENGAAGGLLEQVAGGSTNDNLPEEEMPEPSETIADEENEEASYTLTFTAMTTTGEEFTSDCFADAKLTMINVWATYCNPCLSEMPALGEIAASYDSSEFQLIGIVTDVMEGAASDIEYAQELINETGAAYTHLLLNEALYTNLVGAVDAVPTTFFVNQQGEVLGYVVGAQAKEDWEGLIDELLEENE